MLFQFLVESGKLLSAKHIVHRNDNDWRGNVAQIHSLQNVLPCGRLWQSATGIVVEVECAHRHVEQDEVVLLLRLEYHLLGGIIGGAMIDREVKILLFHEIPDVLSLFLVVFHQEYSFVFTHKLWMKGDELLVKLWYGCKRLDGRLEVGEQGKPCDTRTPEQTERIIDVLTRLHKLFPKAKIAGHHDLPGTTPKACPCLDTHALFGWIENM